MPPCYVRRSTHTLTTWSTWPGASQSLFTPPWVLSLSPQSCGPHDQPDQEKVRHFSLRHHLSPFLHNGFCVSVICSVHVLVCVCVSPSLQCMCQCAYVSPSLQCMCQCAYVCLHICSACVCGSPVFDRMLPRRTLIIYLGFSRMLYDSYCWLLRSRLLDPMLNVWRLSTTLLSSLSTLLVRVLRLSSWTFRAYMYWDLSLIHIWRCRRVLRCRSRWSPYH